MFLSREKAKDYRRNLRKHQTLSESILWEELRNNQMGVKFRRQHSLGIYILDFYCSARKMAIEIDGKDHVDAQNKEKDFLRNKFLESMGITTLRFWSSQVERNIDEVMRIIEMNLTSSSSPKTGEEKW